MKIGAHVSISGNLLHALDRAEKIQANCLQIFSSPPQQWQPPQYTQDVLSQFAQEAIRRNLSPIFIHGTYLINLASDNPFIVQKSIDSLVADLSFSHAVGAKGVIFHFGSHPLKWEGKKTTLIPIIHEILEKTPTDTFFIIENSAGSGNKIGTTLEELAQMVQGINMSRVKVCIDTAHAFAAGYDISTRTSANQFIQQVDELLGWEHVMAIHVNDSKVPRGKKSDRHENIGEGYIGLEGIQTFIHHPLVSPIPCILETPGFDGNGPDIENILRAKGTQKP